MPGADPMQAVRGQYAGYREIDGVEPGSDTETFVALRLEIENWRWANVPILIRAGKALPVNGTEVVVRLQRVPQLRWGSNRLDTPGSDDIVLRVGRNAGVTIGIRAKTPGRDVSQPVSLDLDFAEEMGEPPQPYERLLADALRGDSTLFPRFEVIEETWRIVQPLLDSPPSIETYERGTWGPPSAEKLAAEHGGWRDPAPASGPARMLVDAVAAADEDLGDELGREEPVLNDSRRRIEELGQCGGALERSDPVGDDPVVGRPRCVAELDVAEGGERGGETVLEQLERDRRANRLDELVRRHDHDEPLGGPGDDLLPRVRPSASLDEPAVARDLVGAVDREVETRERVRSGERLEGETRPRARPPPSRARSRRSGRRAGVRRARRRRAPPSTPYRGRPPCRPRRAPPQPRPRAASRARVRAHAKATLDYQPERRTVEPEAGFAGREACRSVLLARSKRRGHAGEPWVPPR